VPLGAPPDVGFGDRLHPDRGHHPGVEPFALQDILEREGVDHRPEHPHVIGGDAVHPHLRDLRSADDVPPADHQPDLRPEVADRLDLLRELPDRVEIEPEALLPGEGLTGELEQDPRIGEGGHRAIDLRTRPS